MNVHGESTRRFRQPDEVFGAVTERQLQGLTHPDFNTPNDSDNTCPRCKKAEYRAGKRGGCATCRGFDPNGSKQPVSPPAPKAAPKKEALTMPRWTEDDIKTLRDNAHKGAKAVGRMLGRPSGTVIAKASQLKVSLKVREPEQAAAEAEELERCEGCGTETADRDSEGVPLCPKCTRVTIEENLRDDLADAGVPADVADRMLEPVREDLAQKFPDEEEEAEQAVRENLRKATEAADALVTDVCGAISVSIENTLGAYELKAVESARSLKLELIDTTLRLIAATAESSVIPASYRASLGDQVDRVRELVKEVTA